MQAQTLTITRWGAALLIACGVVLRLGFLGADSFWLDEAYSVSAVLQHESARAVWEGSVDPNHPPLYFVILWFTLHVAGVSEATARLPSALASVCNLLLVFVLAKRLGLTQRAAVSAVVLLALAPVDIWYAQETRMYALVTTTALLFAIALTMTSWTGAVVAAAVLTVGFYMNYTMVALWALLISLWFVRWLHTDRRPLYLIVVIALQGVAWVAFHPQWAHLGEVLRRIDTVPILVNVREWLGVRVSSGLSALLVMTLIAASAASAVAAVWRWLRHPRFRTWWTWLAWAGFVVSTAALSVPFAYSAKQFLATGWPLVVLIVAWTLTDGKPDERRAASLGRLRLPLAVGVSLVAAIVTVSTPRADWRGVVAHLNDRASRTQAVWIDPSWNSIVYDYYRPELPAVTNPLALAEAGRRQDDAGDVCLVAHRFSRPPPTSPTEAWLDSHLRLVERVSFARLEVRCYAD
ncbi:MAG: glycosyltransferase family 39 protein [Vicinamibacterales bacterium]